MMKKTLLLLLTTFLYAQKPELFLLKNYEQDSNISSWFMSEKLDGVRAYWNGESLISRSGRIFATPQFFIENFPTFELDGELWSKRGDFSNIVSIVNRKKPHKDWSKLTYNIFEVPNADGNLTTRLKKIQNYKKSCYIKLIKQTKIKSKKELNKFLKYVESLGGEGVVIRDATLTYYTGRTKNALKVKSYIDDECIIIAYNKGEGKYKNMIGSFSCQMQNLKIIRIGSGLNNLLRAKPPSIGTVVTFKYYGLTSKGKPRFPVFLKIKR